MTADGRWVVSIDARGHGCSEKPHDPALYGEATMARDLVDLVDRLEVRSYDLVGYSMGGVVALLAATGDVRVRRLVIGGLGAGAIEHGGVDRLTLPPSAVAAAMEAPDPALITEPMAQQMRLFADASGADRFALAAQARAVHGDPISFERILSPTLVIAGESDPLARSPEVLVQALPDARLQRVPGDHFGALFAPSFCDSIVAFLRSD